jgi:outer membrane biosynthesis protein TonB
MHSFARALLVASAVALPLGGCANLDFDPGEWFAGELFSSKKPLPGERKPVFPEGVPGASKGIPPELVKGNELAVQEVEPAPVTEPVAIVEEPKAKPKAKPKPKPKPNTAARPVEAEQDGVWPEPPQQQQQPRQQAQPRQQQQQVQWPDPASSQPRAQPGVQWPDPPPTR